MVTVIIPVGGKGLRMKSETPKQFVKINDKMLVSYTIEKFQKNNNIDNIVLGCLSNYKDLLTDECKKLNFSKVIRIVDGGDNQINTIFNCVKYLKSIKHDNDIIMIHVGNRPLISDELINKTLKSYYDIGNLTTSIPCIEVMVDKISNKTVNRNDYLKIQTPQIFSFRSIYNLMNSATPNEINKSFTIADLMLLKGKKINYINGESTNIKITYPEDMIFIKKLLDMKGEK